MTLRSLSANSAARRAQWLALGLSEDDMLKPKIAVVNSSSELAVCYAHLDGVAKVVKEAIRAAGGVPFEVRTNCEGRESTSAAMLAKRIPDWGFHRDDFRKGHHLVDVARPVDDIFEWGLLGYFVGGAVEDSIPVLDGPIHDPSLIRHKHFGAAAASSGGVEMYHMVGITPEAPDLATAFGGAQRGEHFCYDDAARREVYEKLNSMGESHDVDYVMLGCPHYSLDQIGEAARLIEGRKVHENSALWIFTSRAVKATAEASGYAEMLRKAGALLMTDTCSAISQAIPKGTKVAAFDSAKQTHYLPAIMGIEGWYGTTAECIEAACTGRWEGRLA
ncbi:DUF521 domain-containing protein [Altericroceibacterium spongiae]|uniref:DUF521 domain-containing protein n=1 Tax=Altericroceibacterium spongiae TaxID=2320269 RepID=A0A420ERK2_9SPHN|nr:aconitase X [Altericroceibacterium spongiae]RKF23324.1 DUF521 domain-containing protein [Altericroceibacterium spongiae]